MNKIKVLNEEDINKIINLDMAIEADESAYKQNSSNKGSVWPLVFYEYEHNVFDLDIRSGNLDETQAYGLKLISYNENNPKNGLEKINAVSLVFDSKNGVPLALLNAAPITSYRTGAAAAIGAKYLARKNSKNLLVVGSGNIAIYSLAATLLEIKSITEVNIYNPRHSIDDTEISKILCKIKEILKNDSVNIDNINFTSVRDIESATKNADIIITATPSEKPIIKTKWIKEGTHLSLMGACMIGHQEIEESIFKISKCYADDEKQCLKCGEAQTAYNKGIISKFTDEIGNVISGISSGRTSDKDITIFDSTGLFLQDLATAMKLLEYAKENNIGNDVYI